MISEIGQDSYFHLAARLELLNNLHPMERNLERIITQYKQGNISNFEKSCAQIPNIKLKSHKKRIFWQRYTLQHQLCHLHLHFMRKMKI